MGYLYIFSVIEKPMLEVLLPETGGAYHIATIGAIACRYRNL